jgi:DNA-binding response OmpR family regulator
MDGKKSILIIEDEVDFAEMLRMRLEANDYDVTVVNSGDQGIEHALNSDPHLVLLDVRMPGMDGLQTLEKLKETEQTRDIPVLMLTAKGDARTIFRARSLGSRGYLVKPCSARDLLREVARNVRK